MNDEIIAEFKERYRKGERFWSLIKEYDLNPLDIALTDDDRRASFRSREKEEDVSNKPLKIEKRSKVWQGLAEEWDEACSNLNVIDNEYAQRFSKEWNNTRKFILTHGNNLTVKEYKELIKEKRK